MTVSVVTGGAGFLGAHLVRKLRARGDQVRVLDVQAPSRLPSGWLPAGVEYIQGSVTRPEDVHRAFRGADRAFHLAAIASLWVPDRRAFFRINREGTRVVLEAARAANLERLVHCSTEAVFKGPRRERAATVDETLFRSVRDMRGAYCRAKFLAERDALDAAARGLPVVVVNPTMPLGPGDRELTPPAQMLLDFINGRHPVYLETALNLVDARDVAEGHMLAASRGRAGCRYLLGAADLRMSELLALLNDLTGLAMPRRQIPYGVALAAGIAGELAAAVTGRPPAAPLTGVRLAGSPIELDTTRARAELGASFRPLRDTLADTLADFAGRGLLTRNVSRSHAVKTDIRGRR